MITAAHIGTYALYNDYQCQAGRKKQRWYLQKAACLHLCAAVTTICPIYTKNYYVLAVIYQHILFRVQFREESMWFMLTLLKK